MVNLKIAYRENGDYFIPNLALENEPSLLNFFV